MTVNSEDTPRVQYTANSITTIFPITFVYDDISDVHVYFISNSTGLATAWTKDASGPTGYTVSAGAIVANTAPSNGYLVAVCTTPVTQLVDVKPNRALTADTLEGVFDKITLIGRDLKGSVARALIYGPTYTGSIPYAEDLADEIKQDSVDASVAAVNALTFATSLHIDNLAALRLFPGGETTSIYLDCHTSHLDGGHGSFRWDATSTAADDNGVTIAVTGVATGRWVRQLNGFVTPEMFGAVGDGVVLDTKALQSAITAHSVVYGTPGKSYAISSATSILIPSNRILDFRLSDVTHVGATLNVKAFKNATYFAGSVFDENITIKNLTINGNGSDGNRSDQGAGIGFWGVRGVLLENVKTNNTNGDGIQFRESYGTVLRNIEIGDYGRNGISPTSGEFVYDNVVISGDPFTGAAPGKDFDAENNSATERGVHDIRYIKCKNMTFVDFYNTTGNPFNHDIYFHAGDVSGYLPLRILSKGGQTVAKKIYISPLVNIECQDVTGNAAIQIESTDGVNLHGTTLRRLGATGTQRGIQIVGTCSGLVLNNVEFEGSFTRDIEASGAALLDSSILNGVFYNLLIQGSSNKIRGSIETLLRIAGAASINNEISADVAAVSVETGAVLASQFFGNPRGLASTAHYSTEVTVGAGPTYDLTIPLPSAATSGRLLFVAAGYSYIGNASHWAQYFGTVRIGSGEAAEANVISATGAAGMSITVVAVTTTSITLRLTYTYGGVFSATVLG